MGRPAARFHDFIGHKQLVDPLRQLLAGAQARGEAMHHLLLSGPSGVGKTNLAEALAKESGTRLIRVMGSAAREILVKKLCALKQGDFMFLDEAHALKPADQEFFFEVIDRGRITVPDLKDGKPAAGKGQGKVKFKRLRLPAFTLVLATDRPGLLLDPLKKRLPNRIDLPRYPLKEIKEIVAVIASQEQVLLSPQATRRLASVCHGLPRKAKHFVQRLRHFYPADQSQLSVQDVKGFLSTFGIDRHGLGRQERKYLRFLTDTGSASLDTLAQHLGTDRDEVLHQVEPILVDKGLVAIASSGRRLTPKGQKYLAPKQKSAASKGRTAS